jgi:hypothetical protein
MGGQRGSNKRARVEDAFAAGVDAGRAAEADGVAAPGPDPRFDSFVEASAGPSGGLTDFNDAYYSRTHNALREKYKNRSYFLEALNDFSGVNTTQKNWINQQSAQWLAARKQALAVGGRKAELVESILEMLALPEAGMPDQG